MSPQRVQMTRQAPWRHAHPRAVIVDRRTSWGNPHKVGERCAECGGTSHLPAEAVTLYRRHLAEHPQLLTAARDELAGRDLACWCPPGQPCHADVLLEIANASEEDADLSRFRPS